MSRFEFQSFLEFAPHYFRYIHECLDNEVRFLRAENLSSKYHFRALTFLKLLLVP